LRRSHFRLLFACGRSSFPWSGACVCKSFFPSYVLRTKVSIHPQMFFADGRCHVSETRVLVPEPWLRGTLRDVPAVHRGVLHALQLAQEDLGKWCRPLAEEQLKARPGGLPPVAFHLRHIARSMDRLLTYAEEGQLGEAQVSALKSEWDAEVCGEHCSLRLRGPLCVALNAYGRSRRLTWGRNARSERSNCRRHLADCSCMWRITRSGM